MKRIAHILPWAGMAGTELATLRVAEAARRAGYENLFYLPRIKDPDPEAFLALAAKHGFETVWYDQVYASWRNPLPYLRNVAALAADFRRRHIALVHSADILGAYYTAWASRLAGICTVCHVRNEHGDVTPFERLVLKAVQRFLLTSEGAVLGQGFHLPPERTEILYDAAILPGTLIPAPEARAHYGLPQDAIVFGMAARVADQKDHTTLIRAMAIAAPQRPDLHVLLVGDHEVNPLHRKHFAGLSVLMDETGTRERMHFAGFEADMARFLGAIDAMVLATHKEGFPLVILEAMGAGKAVVATAVNGIPEAIVDGVTGFLVPLQDPDALAKALLTLANDPELLVRMGEAGRARAEAVFGPARFDRAVADFYGRMIGPP
ncbi:glycosyltransferase [Aquabacter sp. CN5-332]|uniref:glycosyltransferase n=1 Tax=Aquabacter sp. CN5-332 TaxID=3156608 RepID=UPI0032B5275F